MCGRFQVTIELVEFLRDWNRQAPIWLSPDAFEERVKTGEIRPTDYWPVMLPDNGKIGTKVMRWGLIRPWSKSPLINARSETVTQKPAFRDIAGNRCVIPAGGYYDWSREGKKTIQKYLFNLPDTPKLYMAGLYEQAEDGYRFIILTTAANRWIRDIHDRMPVILKKDECRNWLHNSVDLDVVANRQLIEMMRLAIE